MMTIAKITANPKLILRCRYGTHLVLNSIRTLLLVLFNLGFAIANNIRYLVAIALILMTSVVSFADEDLSITTDSRIKTYVYSPNEVYLLVVHSGFQSQIEFAKGEEIHTISLGDSYAWKITPLGNRLFVKPLEKNIRTNMTILTNKRTYQFDIVARELDGDDDKDLVYVLRFYYPNKKIR